MAYVRDKDSATRGAGAIAAADMAAPRARSARRAEIARNTSARDRAMGAIANGALGLVDAGSLRDRRQLPTHGRPGTATPQRPTRVIMGTSGQRPTAGPNSTWNGYNAGTATSAPPLIRMPPVPGTRTNDPTRGTTLAKDPPGGAATRPPVTSPPIIAPMPIDSAPIPIPVPAPVPATAAPKPTVTVTGGGSGAGIPAGTIQSPPIMAPRMSTADPQLPAGTGQGDSMRNVLLIGGGLAAAWLIFGRKGGR